MISCARGVPLDRSGTCVCALWGVQGARQAWESTQLIAAKKPAVLWLITIRSTCTPPP